MACLLMFHGLAPISSAHASERAVLLDNFENLSGWSASASPRGRAWKLPDIRRDSHKAMRLDFEFSDEGFVIARKTLQRRLQKISYSAMRCVVKRRAATLNLRW